MSDTDVGTLSARARRVHSEIDSLVDDSVRVRDQHVARLDALSAMFSVLEMQAINQSACLSTIRALLGISKDAPHGEIVDRIAALTAKQQP
jgi:hypothetical protein